MFGLSIWELLIILVIVMLIFGPKRLTSIGGELGNAIKGFRKAVSEDQAPVAKQDAKVIDGTDNQSDSKRNSDASRV